MNRRILKENQVIIVAIVVVIVVTCGILITFLISFSPASRYVVESKRSTTCPSQYIAVNASVLGQYPLLFEIIDAFDNPGKYPGAVVEEYNLTYEINEYQNGPHRVSMTTDYLGSRLLEEYGPPLHTPYYFSYFSSGDNQTYYFSWEVTVLD